MTEPILQWVGGKRRLLPILHSAIPYNYNRYFEIFLGAGSLLFNLQPNKAICFEKNKNLCDLYQCVKYNTIQVFEELKKILEEYSLIETSKGTENVRSKTLFEEHNKTQTKQLYYLFLRKEFNDLIFKLRDIHSYKQAVNSYNNDDYIKKSVLLLFLNKTCFNAVYRENSKGEFNVPFGNGRKIVLDLKKYKQSLIKMQKYLLFSETQILNNDFEEILKFINKGDLVYMDPPYYPVNEQSFTSYSKEGFSKEDHSRVIKVCNALAEKGAFVILSNSNTPWIKENLPNWNIKEISVSRSINSDSTGRTKQNCEIIATNY